MTRWGELKCPECADLKGKLRASALQELSALGQASEAYQAQLAAEAERDALAEEIERLRKRLALWEPQNTAETNRWPIREGGA